MGQIGNNQWVCHCIRPGFDSRMNMEFSEVYDHLLPTVEPLKRLIPVPVVHRTGLKLVSCVANACNKSRLATAVTEDPYTLYANKQTRVAWAMMLFGIIHLSADICNVNIKTYTIVYQVLFLTGMGLQMPVIWVCNIPLVIYKIIFHPYYCKNVAVS